MKESQHIQNLMIKRLSGEANQSEIDQLEAWFKANPEDQYTFEMLRDWWNFDGSSLANNDNLNKNARESFDRLQQRILLNQENPDEEEGVSEVASGSTPGLKRWGIAAIVLVLIGGISFFLITNSPSLKKIKNNPPGMSQISTDYGSKSKITLPDGTSVWLNAGSNLTYNNREFATKNREVTLSGEAYFDVAKKANLPFIIHSGEVDVKVLGTAFNVKAYPEDTTIQATLIKGAIAVSFVKKPERIIRLKPDQTITVYKEKVKVHSTKKQNQQPEEQSHKKYTVAPLTLMPHDSLIVETSWLENKLAFRAESFVALARQMSRRYDVRFQFEDKEVKTYHFTGILADESLEQALKALKITAPFNYKISGKVVYIYK